MARVLARAARAAAWIAAALAIFGAATFALFRAKAGVIPVIAACGVAGLLLSYL